MGELKPKYKEFFLKVVFNRLQLLPLPFPYSQHPRPYPFPTAWEPDFLQSGRAKVTRHRTYAHCPELRRDQVSRARVRVALALPGGQVLTRSPLGHSHHPLFISISFYFKAAVLPGSGMGYPASPPLEANASPAGGIPHSLQPTFSSPPPWMPSTPVYPLLLPHNHGGAPVTALLVPWIHCPQDGASAPWSSPFLRLLPLPLPTS